MSELKDYDIMDIEDMDDERLEKSESGKIQVTRVYIKSEADKVIADLKNKIEEQKRIRDMALASVPNVLKVMKIIQHHKYKRCLAMAKLCVNGEIKLKRVKIRDMNNHQFWQFDNDYWQKRNNRWLKIAEQFKESK